MTSSRSISKIPTANHSNDPTSMMAPGQCHPGDPRPILARAMGTAGEAIAAVRPDQMTMFTPCDEFDVRRLIGHLVMALERVAVVGRNGNPFAVGDDLEPLADDAWADGWRARSVEALRAWEDDAALVRPTPLPWAPASGAQALGTYIAELSVHTWDLATATGQAPKWDDEVLTAGLAAMKAALPATGRPEMFAAMRAEMGMPDGAMPDPYGPAVVVTEDASLIDQLVAYNGRTPR